MLFVMVFSKTGVGFIFLFLSCASDSKLSWRGVVPKVKVPFKFLASTQATTSSLRQSGGFVE